MANFTMEGIKIKLVNYRELKCKFPHQFLLGVGGILEYKNDIFTGELCTISEGTYKKDIIQ